MGPPQSGPLEKEQEGQEEGSEEGTQKGDQEESQGREDQNITRGRLVELIEHERRVISIYR